MVNIINVLEMIRDYPGTILCLKADDLGHFADELISKSREKFLRERSQEESSNDKYFTADEVKKIYNISESTLYRLGKAGLLVPSMIGGQRRYSKVSLDNFAKSR